MINLAKKADYGFYCNVTTIKYFMVTFYPRSLEQLVLL
jgi:hypothetical protein